MTRQQTILRAASDWVDLQWSLLIRVLESVAPQSRGRLLDVGCGDRPFERIFRPYVDEYVGVEHEATFDATAARFGRSRPPRKNATYELRRSSPARFIHS